MIVIRAHNPGKRAVQVVRVDLINSNTGRKEHLAHLPMPRTIAPDAGQLWYTSFEALPRDLYASITLIDGKTFESPRYAALHGYKAIERSMSVMR